MIKSKDIKKYVDSINIQPVILALIFVIMGITFVASPHVFAASLNVTREIDAPADQVWNIISNVDNEPAY